MQLYFHSCTSYISNNNNNSRRSSNSSIITAAATITFTTTTNSTTTTTITIILNRMLFSINTKTCVAYTCNVMSPYTCLLFVFSILFFLLILFYIESFWMLFIGLWFLCAIRCCMLWPIFYGHFTRHKSYDQNWCAREMTIEQIIEIIVEKRTFSLTHTDALKAHKSKWMWKYINLFIFNWKSMAQMRKSDY